MYRPLKPYEFFILNFKFVTNIKFLRNFLG